MPAFNIELKKVQITQTSPTTFTVVLGTSEHDPLFMSSEAANFEAGDKAKLDATATDADLQAHIDNVSNPHSVTKTQVGLGNVDNIQQQPLNVDLTTIAELLPANNDFIQRKSGEWINRTPAQVKTDLSLTKSDVGLSNVDNTSDANKPISTATQTALDGKVPVTRTVNGYELDEDITLAKSDVGLGNVDNTSDANKPISTATQDALDLKADLVDGKIPTAQLPSYVDDVEAYADLAGFPVTGETGKIYIALDTNITYRWNGSGYTEISASLALGETSATAYRGDRGKAAYDHSLLTSGNPHNVTKTDIGLSNVNNTSDANKPISTATQAALDLTFLLGGRSGGQDAYGGTGSAEEYKLHSTSHGTKGKIVISRQDAVTTPVSFATQISSEILAFRQWQYDGANPQITDFNIQAVPRAASSTADWAFKFGSSVIMNLTSLLGINMFGQNTIQVANTSITTPSGHLVLNNNNSTVDNFESVLFRNQGGMTVAFLAARNKSHNATTGSADMEVWTANGATATNTWVYKADGTHRALSIGAAATSFATQKSSNILGFEGSMWNGSAETKQSWTVQAIPNTTAQSLELRFIFGATSGMRLVSTNSGPSYTQIDGYVRVTGSDSATTPTLTNLNNVFLYNTNTTVDNFSQVINRNANGMFTGAMVFRNKSHNASTGSADIEWWLANGATIAKVMALKANGNVEFADAATLVFGSTNGVKIGATTDKLAFYGGTPIVRPVGANQAALTDSTTGTPAFTVVDVGGAFSQATLNNNFASITRLLNQIRSDLVALNAIKGAA